MDDILSRKKAKQPQPKQTMHNAIFLGVYVCFPPLRTVFETVFVNMNNPNADLNVCIFCG